MKAILESALKGNEFLKKGIITGITKMTKVCFYRRFNKMKISDDNLKKAVKEWYHGYEISEYTMYNPWSIGKFFTYL